MRFLKKHLGFYSVAVFCVETGLKMSKLSLLYREIREDDLQRGLVRGADVLVMILEHAMEDRTEGGPDDLRRRELDLVLGDEDEIGEGAVKVELRDVGEKVQGRPRWRQS